MNTGAGAISKHRRILLFAALLSVAVSLTVGGAGLASSSAQAGPSDYAALNRGAGIARQNWPIGSCPVPSFAPPTDYPVGDFPTGVTSADFNNDGNDDLATGNATPGTVSVLLGNGTGGFGPATTFPAGESSGDITSADFNHDGNPDLAVARSAGFPDNVSVLLGNGSGAFGPPILLVAGTTPDTIRVGDFNEDTHLDLVTTNFNSANVSVFLGDGTGGFGGVVNFSAGSRPSGLEVGDFNEDSNLDIAAGNSILSGTVSILLGNGTGGFGSPTAYPVGEAGPLAQGDFDEDGHIDLAAGVAPNIAILLGNGSGGFGPPTPFPAGGRPASIVAADFTMDGNLDLASANLLPTDVAVLVGNGAGGFGPPVFFPAGNFPGSLVTGDFNQDGALDLAGSNSDSDDVSVRLNTCLPATTATPSHTPTAPATATHTTTPTAPATATHTPTTTYTATSTPTTTATATPTNTPILPTTTPTRTPVTPAPTSTPTACTLQFTDVPPDNTFYPFVWCLACRGIINGYACGGPGEPCDSENNPYFRPGNNITRGQISKIVSESAGLQDDPGQQIYEDVAPSNPFYVWINRLSLHGHMSGYACGGAGEPCGPGNRPYFRWGANATRGQLSKIVSNAAGFSDPPSGQFFEDVPPTHPFYEWIQRLASRGIMSGYACGGPGEPCGPGNRPYFRPFNSVTRGQASKIVSSAFFPECSAATGP